MRRNSVILSILCLIALIGAGIYYINSEVSPDAVDPNKGKSQLSRMAFGGSSVVEEKDGRKISDLSARVIEVDTQTKIIYFQDLKAVYFREGAGWIEMTAISAMMNPDTHDISMEGDINAKTENGATFRADAANYYAREQRITAVGRIRATQGDMVLTGNELETDPSLEKIKITGQAKVVKGGAPQ